MSCTFAHHHFPAAFSERGHGRVLLTSPPSFHDAPYGVPGNSDAGALNSWLLWQMLGLYPVVTQPIYLLSSPWFTAVNLTINNAHTLQILAHNLSNSDSYYVQSIRVNGRDWEKNWISHEDVMVEGGTIEFFLGSEPTEWETGEAPGSPGHVVLGDGKGTGGS